MFAEFGDDAKVIAGGQSLVPMMALRLARFDHLVDLSAIPALHGVQRGDGSLSVGAMTTHRDLERGAGAAVPLLALAAPYIGHAQIRNRGTVGGSCAHADPAAEWPAVALALDARFEVSWPERAADHFGRGLLRLHVHDGARTGRDSRDGRTAGVGRSVELRGGRIHPQAWRFRYRGRRRSSATGRRGPGGASCNRTHRTRADPTSRDRRRIGRRRRRCGITGSGRAGQARRRGLRCRRRTFMAMPRSAAGSVRSPLSKRLRMRFKTRSWRRRD